MAIPDPCRALPDIAATFSNAYLTSLCVVILNEHCCPSVLLPCLSLSPHSAVLLFLPSTAFQLRLQLHRILPLLLVLARSGLCFHSTASSHRQLLNKVAFAAVNCHLCRFSLSLSPCWCLLLPPTVSLYPCVSVAGLSMWKNRFQFAVPVPERTNLPANFS